MFRYVCASIGLAVLMASPPAVAQEHHHFDHGHGGGHQSPGGIRHWHGGNWHHGWHNGRLGWWWASPGLADWVYYDTPTYPYPDPYTPPGVASAGPGYWYYCQSPPGYFPYVQQCALPWQPVPAAPPG